MKTNLVGSRAQSPWKTHSWGDEKKYSAEVMHLTTFYCGFVVQCQWQSMLRAFDIPYIVQLKKCRTPLSDKTKRKSRVNCTNCSIGIDVDVQQNLRGIEFRLRQRARVSVLQWEWKRVGKILAHLFLINSQFSRVCIALGWPIFWHGCLLCVSVKSDNFLPPLPEL